VKGGVRLTGMAAPRILYVISAGLVGTSILSISQLTVTSIASHTRFPSPFLVV
jgi:hypothetical protein